MRISDEWLNARRVDRCGHTNCYLTECFEFPRPCGMRLKGIPHRSRRSSALRSGRSRLMEIKRQVIEKRDDCADLKPIVIPDEQSYDCSAAVPLRIFLRRFDCLAFLQMIREDVSLHTGGLRGFGQNNERFAEPCDRSSVASILWVCWRGLGPRSRVEICRASTVSFF